MYNFWHTLTPRELSVLIKLKFVLIVEVSVGRGFITCCHSFRLKKKKKKKKIQGMATQTLNTKFHPISRHEEIGANAYASRIIRKL